MTLFQKVLVAWVAGIVLVGFLGFAGLFVYLAVNGPVQPAANVNTTEAISEFNSQLASENYTWAIDAVKLDRDTLVISVRDFWHRQGKQDRLQAAQNMWAMWAEVYSPDDPDKARIRITDTNGNRVGGSSVAAGSILWVAD